MKTISSSVESLSLQKTAKIAGLAYLLIVLVPMLSLIFIDPKITVRDDIAATINNIIANEILFRIDMIISLLMFVAVVILAVTLYRILKDVNKLLAQISLFWRFAEALVGIVAVLSSVILLSFITGDTNKGIFGADQFYALSEFLLGIYWETTVIVFVLLALGSIIAFYLFLKSKLIPKALSIWGITSYSLVLIGALISLLFSGNAYMILGSQTILFEVVIGCWLLLKGLNISKEQVLKKENN